MYCTVDGIDVHYVQIGEGRPVLLIHGFYPDHRLMMGCMEPIFSHRQGYRRVYVDLPGMGMTKASEAIATADDMLDLLVGFIDRVMPDEPFLLAGQSYGGLLSRGIRYRMPERVGGLMLLCPCIVPERSGRDRPAFAVLRQDRAFVDSLDPSQGQTYLEEVVIQTPRTFARFRDEVQCGMDIADERYLEAYRVRGFGFSFDVDEPGRSYDMPALFLLGKQDAHVGYKDAWRILGNDLNATYAALDQAGHSLQIEQEGLFNALVGEWLDRCERPK